MTVTTKEALSIGKAIHSLALSYAAKTGTAIDLVVVTGANAKDEFKLTSNRLKASIEANLSQEEIDGLPLPGSRWNDGGIANQTCDIFQWRDPSKDQDSKPREVSFYVTWADNTPEGRNVCREIDWCKRINKENMKIDDIPQTWQDTFNDPQKIADRLAYLEGRRVTIRAAYKEAVKLIWWMDAVNELTGCKATMSADGAQVLVENKADPKGGWKYYSVGAFLRLNPKQAAEQLGSYAALKATEKRDPKSKKKETGVPALNSVQTPETMDKVGVVFHSYLDKTLANTGAADYALLLKHLTGDAGRQSILTLGGIKECIDKLFRMDTIRAVYDSEKEKLSKAA